MAKETLTEKCIRLIKQDIQNGKYTTNDWISEKEICQQQGVSKATAGEALQRLTQEGILTVYPRKGYKLYSYNRADFMRIQELRFSIESLVIHRLITEVDTAVIAKQLKNYKQMANADFHRALATLTEDPFIFSALDNLLIRCETAYDNLEIVVENSDEIYLQHEKILNAIYAKDEQKAVDELRNDLQLSNADMPLPLWGQYKALTTSDMDKFVYLSDPQFSDDGQWIAFTQYHAEVETGKFYPEGKLIQLTSKKEITAGKGNVKTIRFLGNHSYAYLDDVSGEYQIWIGNTEDGETKQLTTARHGIVHYSYSNGLFAFEAKLWKSEVEDETALVEMTVEQKQDWLDEKDNAPIEITEIDYKRDEVKGVRDGSQGVIGTVTLSGEQNLIAFDIPYQHPILSPNGEKIAIYGQPYHMGFFSRVELFVMNADGSDLKMLTENKTLSGDAVPAFTTDGSEIVYPAYYFGEDGFSLYLYKISVTGGEEICLFDPKAKESDIGVYNFPAIRTQYGEEKSYFAVKGNYAYFVSAWKGREGLYRISLKGNSKPQAVIEGDFSVHEFAFCAKSSDILITRGDYTTLRDLYMYHPKTGTYTRLRKSNQWLDLYSLADVEVRDVPTADEEATIHCAIHKPANFDASRKYPAVLYVHGGPEICYTNDFWHELHILAGAGYIVLTCDPRGSAGYGKAFCQGDISWSQKAIDDLMTFLDSVIAEGYIDETKVGITGGSYGGYTTCKVIMQTNRFAAAVGQRVFVNPATSYGTGDIGFYSNGMPYDQINIKECLINRARSAILRNMDNINTPLLLLHGYNDYRCSFEQSEQMFISMKERRPEVPVRLVMFPGENHGVSRTGLIHFQKRHVQEMIDWFDLYLKGDAENDEEK